MPPDLLAIYGSPRKNGNTDTLLSYFINGAKSSDIEVEEIFLRDLIISCCHGCRACDQTGICIIQDDMSSLYSQFSKCTFIAVASPIYFYAVSSLTKIMIDRCQCFWAKKYLLKTPNNETTRKGLFFSVGGSNGEKLFNGARLTVKYFFDALDIEYCDELFMRQVDNKGDINKHADLLEKAYNIGMNLYKI